MMNLEERIPRYKLVTGRAATALFLLFSQRLPPGSKVLYPANICYAAVYPAIYAGCVPVFCDVDPWTGNITRSHIEKVLREHSISAVVLPHMYGNPISDMSVIVALVHEYGALVIEDCASAYGAKDEWGATVGFLGDFTIYSTGYSKTVDIGFGGLLASATESLDYERELLEKLPVWDKMTESLQTCFSRQYRHMRNLKLDYKDFGRAVFQACERALKPAFLFQLTDIESEKVLLALQHGDNAISLRNKRQLMWQRLTTSFLPLESLYPFASGAVPWRFSLFVKGCVRSSIIRALLDRQVPVSDWYPSIAGLFGDMSLFNGAYEMGESILNFPLTISEYEIKRYVMVLHEAIHEAGGMSCLRLHG